MPFKNWKENIERFKSSKLRSLHFWWQRRIRGWDDSELWSLDFTIFEFAAPRLRRFAEISVGYPLHFNLTDEEIDGYWELSGEEQQVLNRKSEEGWTKAVNKMARAMEIILEKDGWLGLDEELEQEVKEGLELFHEYFDYLWD
jgi:hypothetical protein